MLKVVNNNCEGEATSIANLFYLRTYVFYLILVEWSDGNMF